MVTARKKFIKKKIINNSENYSTIILSLNVLDFPLLSVNSTVTSCSPRYLSMISNMTCVKSSVVSPSNTNSPSMYTFICPLMKVMLNFWIGFFD